jgi:hypothetical protein
MSLGTENGRGNGAIDCDTALRLQACSFAMVPLRALASVNHAECTE